MFGMMPSSTISSSLYGAKIDKIIEKEKNGREIFALLFLHSSTYRKKRQIVKKIVRCILVIQRIITIFAKKCNTRNN